MTPDALRERIAALSPPQRALLQRQLAARGHALPLPLPAPPADEPLPLTPAQRQLWVIQQLQPDSSAYHIAFAWRSESPLDAGALQAATQALVDRHEALRTVFDTDADGQPVQRTLAGVRFELQHSRWDDVDAADAEAGDAALAARLQALAAAPFDLRRAPLLRAQLIALPGGRQLLLWVLHHLVADGWSRGVLMRELAALYAAALHGRDAALPPLPVSAAHWQRRRLQWLAGAPAAAMADWWRRQLAGLAPLTLPADRPHHAGADWRSATLQRRLPALAPRVAAAAAACGATPFMLLLTVFKLLLVRWSGRRDLAVAIPVAGRDDPQMAELIGFFVNTLVVRSRVPEAGRVADWVDAVKRALADAFDHAELPLARVIDAAGAAREPGRSPLVELMFQYQGDGYGAQNSARLRLGEVPLQQLPVLPAHTKFDMTWHAIERDGGLLLAVEYRSALFDAPRIERWLDHFERLLLAVLDDPQRPAGSLPMLSAAEAAAIADWQQGPPAAGGVWSGFVERFERQAARTPQAAAVATAQGPALSYRQLDVAAGALAEQLCARGIGREAVVGVCLPRVPMLLVAMLAVWKAGAAWLALDPALPDERLRYMARDSGAALLLALAPDAARFDDPGQPPLRVLPQRPDRPDAVGAKPLRGVAGHPDALAYVLYTSGSTGRPKGTLLPQRGLMHYLDWCLQRYPLDAGGGAPVHSSIGFDATITALFAPLLAGRCVTLLHETTNADALAALADAMAGGHSLVKLTPAHMTALAPLLQSRPAIAADRLPRAFVIGGEALTEAHVAWWRERHPGIALLNEYGPTETVVGCCVHEVTADDAGALPIGRPIRGAALYLLDADFNPVPAGAVGEIFIGGAGMARGYLGRAALTAERFLPDPFARKAGACMYRSGDLASWRADGSIAYLGRADQQLQLRGYRIEAGEVEAALVRQSGVAAAVVGVAAVGSAPALIAWVRAEPGTAPEPAALRRALAAWLPAYMVPAQVIVVDALPLTANGKVDRAALPLPAIAADDGGTAAAPDDPAYRALHAIWREVLGRGAIGADDNFFDLGGDSVAAMQIVARAHQAGYALAPAELFAHQTLAAQAAVARPLAGPAAAVVADEPAWLAPAQWALLQRAQHGELPQPAHWNQSLLLDVDAALDAAALDAALQTLPARHAALRQRFTRGESGWQVRHAAAAGLPLQVVELDGQPLAPILQAAQRTLDLAEGPLLRALLLREPGGAQRLLLVAHHLVVDAHSWRLLVADLMQALASPGAAVEPAPALAQWTDALAAQAGDFARELPYWQAALRSGARLPRRVGAAPSALEADSVEHQLRLGDASAERLQAAARALGCRPDTLLLAALAQTLLQWSRGDALVIDVEHHGRGLDGLAIDAAPAQLPPGGPRQAADLARSVGWFTAVWPLRLQLPAGAPQRQLQAVQQTLAAVPQHGLGFGVLRQHAGLGASPAELSFNHLGALPAVAAGPLRGLAGEPVPAQRDPAARRAYLLEVLTLLHDGELRWVWRHDARIAAATVDALARRTAAQLQTLYALRPVDG